MKRALSAAPLIETDKSDLARRSENAVHRPRRTGAAVFRKQKFVVEIM
jgi:hypothetical protein